MASLTDKGRERLALLEQAEKSGKLTDKGAQVLSQLRGVSGESTSKPDNRGIIRKAWDAAHVPAQMAESGLNQIANMVPEPKVTGNVLADVVRGAKPIIEKSGVQALAKVAPSFIGPEAIALSLAGQTPRMISKIPKAGPRIIEGAKDVMRGIGRQGESISGAAPGALEAAYKDPTIMGAKGKKAVQGMYEKAKQLGGDVRSELKETSDPKEFVDKALQFAKDKTLTPLEGLEARKTLQSIKKRVTDQFFRTAKDKFDAVAKTVFKGEDAAYQRANMAESLRNIAPQNKYGGASAFKMMIANLAASNDGLAGKALAAALSPAAQGTVASAAGSLARIATSPRAASTSGALLDAVNRKRKKK